MKRYKPIHRVCNDIVSIQFKKNIFEINRNEKQYQLGSLFPRGLGDLELIFNGLKENDNVLETKFSIDLDDLLIMAHVASGKTKFTNLKEVVFNIFGFNYNLKPRLCKLSEKDINKYSYSYKNGKFTLRVLTNGNTVCM